MASLSRMTSALSKAVVSSCCPGFSIVVWAVFIEVSFHPLSNTLGDLVNESNMGQY